MSHIFLPAILVLIIIELIFNMTNEYIFINRVLCLSISVLIFIISIVKVKNRDLGILKYLGIGCFFIAIIRFLDIELSHFITDNNIVIAFTQIIVYFEMLNIILSMILYYKNYKERIQWIILFFIMIIISFILKDENNILSKLALIFTSRRGIIINQVVVSILFILSVVLYNNFKLQKEDRWILRISFFSLLSNTFLFISLLVNIELNFFIWISKSISYFLLYDKFEETLLSNAYSSAYESLNRAKEIKKSLNKNLKRREKELKELNLLLEKSEKKYFDVVQAFSNGILLFENDILTYSNYSENKYCNIINELQCNDRMLNLNEILNVITGKEYSKEREVNEFSTEIRIIAESGEEKYLEILLMKIYDNRKILVFNDISEIIKQREEIVKIEKKIKEENIKDEFYSNISHELRTPINVIYSALQLNDVYLDNNQIHKINNNNNIIRQNCLRLIRTINNFIDSNKLSEGYLERDCKIYNVVDIIENIVLSCDFYMKLKNTKLTYDPQYEEIYLYCDKSHIERIMLNILSNSLKYGKDNGNIYVTTKVCNNEKIIIEVVNDAEAIPEDKRNEIFDKFTKVNTSLNRPSEGSGLGLYLTKGLVELHGGEISINAGKKYGNIFKIELPYDKNIKSSKAIVNNNIEINNFNQKIDIEFSDIYF
ncbi:sensor histidine kinase [Clostridium nigeriense]|nr:HAMP domain-containing sensor histidine kinase [Clostridium nigeriense]